MCGICGVFGRTDRDVVGRMLATIRHRGPDDEFIVSGDGFTMAAARLSIIDVAGGRQPLTNEDGTVTASQNGEIFIALLRDCPRNVSTSKCAVNSFNSSSGSYSKT